MIKFIDWRLTVKVVFMGTPKFAVAPLQHLVVNHYQVVAVYTQPDKVAGRGRTLVYSPQANMAPFNCDLESTSRFLPR